MTFMPKPLRTALLAFLLASGVIAPLAMETAQAAHAPYYWHGHHYSHRAWGYDTHHKGYYRYY